MKRTVTFALSALALAGCQAILPPVTDQPGRQLASATGTMSVSLLWPKRQAQVIPLSAQAIRLRVLKGGTVSNEMILPRPDDTGAPLVASASMILDAGSYAVEAAAFQGAVVHDADTPIATATASATIVASQRTPLQLTLQPAFIPTLTGFSPTNGGPGTPVTLTGSFGGSGYYGLSLAGIRVFGSASGSDIVALIPDHATSSPMIALADGVPSSPGATFTVLAGLSLAPQMATCSVHDTIQVAATGMNTANQAVASPTITQWEVVDPEKLGWLVPPPSTVGTISNTGLFTAQATGTAWVRAWSGYLSATASIQVD